MKEAIEYLLAGKNPLCVTDVYRQLCCSLGQKPIEPPTHERLPQKAVESIVARNFRHQREFRNLVRLVSQEIQRQIPEPPIILTVYNKSFGGLVKCGAGSLVTKHGGLFNYKVNLDGYVCLVPPYYCKEITECFGIDPDTHLADMRAIRWG